MFCSGTYRTITRTYSTFPPDWHITSITPTSGTATCSVRSSDNPWRGGYFNEPVKTKSEIQKEKLNGIASLNSRTRKNIRWR